jgi:hypothetical protein
MKSRPYPYPYPCSAEPVLQLSGADDPAACVSRERGCARGPSFAVGLSLDREVASLDARVHAVQWERGSRSGMKARAAQGPLAAGWPSGCLAKSKRYERQGLRSMPLKSVKLGRGIGAPMPVKLREETRR